MTFPTLSPGEVQARMVFAWQAAPAPDLVRLAMDVSRQMHLLGLVLAFEEIFAKGGSTDYAGDIAPLAARIDWLLNWMLLSEETDGIHDLVAHPIVLTPTTACWVTDRPVFPGEWGVLRLYPDVRLARPVTFWAEIETTQPVAEGWEIRAQWRGHSKENSDLFEKLLFRLHRQEVALARQKN